LRLTVVLAVEAAADTTRTSLRVLDDQQTGIGALGVSTQNQAAVG
jgi:hypothetical protein